MACKQWNDDWVAHLYGELEPHETTRLTEHLERCASCAETLQQLSSTREVLHQCAPAVPSAPRVVVLRPRPAWRPVWAFAAGLACALLVFAIGLNLLPAGGTADQQAQLARLEQRLQQIEQLSPVSQNVLTRQEFEAGLTRLAQRGEVDRARDFEFLLTEISAVEYRNGSRINTNREALRYAMLASRPEVSEK